MPLRWRIGSVSCVLLSLLGGCGEDGDTLPGSGGTAGSAGNGAASGIGGSAGTPPGAGGTAAGQSGSGNAGSANAGSANAGSAGVGETGGTNSGDAGEGNAGGASGAPDAGGGEAGASGSSGGAAGSPGTEGFVHPGCLSTAADLGRMREKVAASAEPWKASWDRLVANSHAELTYSPNPQATICAGGVCEAENYMTLAHDAAAAYQMALRYHISEDTA